jgi:hypothetical protein
MANIDNDFQTLNANFKQVYADNIENIIPDGVVLYKMVPMVAKQKAEGNV